MCDLDTYHLRVERGNISRIPVQRLFFYDTTAVGTLDRRSNNRVFKQELFVSSTVVAVTSRRQLRFQCLSTFRMGFCVS